MNILLEVVDDIAGIVVNLAKDVGICALFFLCIITFPLWIVPYLIRKRDKL